MHSLEGPLARSIATLASEAAPAEAVGLILSDGCVVALTNLASANNAFRVSKTEILDALGTESDFKNVAFWHSHPAGGVGPSRTDMANKMPFSYHLVVSLVNGDPIFTWY
jgi:proteasome lid subunit RPN8/RPN11